MIVRVVLADSSSFDECLEELALDGGSARITVCERDEPQDDLESASAQSLELTFDSLDMPGRCNRS